MKKKIFPSLIATSQKQLEQRFEKIKKTSSSFHLDVMDGKFVKNKSLNFDFKLPKNKKYGAHLIVKNPEKWIEKNLSKVNTIIVHIEPLKKPEEILELIKKIKRKRKKFGLAINPRTKVSSIEDYLKKIDEVLIMTVNPGAYGGKFIPSALNKIKEIKKMNKKIKIKVDGGMNPERIKKASKFGADSFVVGSYIQKSENPKQAMKELKDSCKR